MINPAPPRKIYPTRTTYPYFVLISATFTQMFTYLSHFHSMKRTIAELLKNIGISEFTGIQDATLTFQQIS